MPTADNLPRGRRCVLAVLLLLASQFVLFASWEAFVEPFTVLKVAAWLSGLVPLFACLSLLWGGNRPIERLLLLAHALLALGVGALFASLLLVPWPAGEEQRKAWFLVGIGAMSALICLLLSRPSTRAFLEHRRGQARGPSGG